MGNGPSIPSPVVHFLNAVSLGIWIGIMVKIGCDKTGKCRNPRDVELSLPPCNYTRPKDIACLWTTNNGHQFVSVPSVDVYVKQFQVVKVASPDACLQTCAGTTGCIGSRFAEGACYLTGGLASGSTTSIDELEQSFGMDHDDLLETMGIKAFPILDSCPTNFDTYCSSSGANAGCITPNRFTIRCGRGVLGTNMPDDMQSFNTTSLSGCIDSCKNTDGCVAVAFKQEAIPEQGLCSLKNTVYAGVVDEAFIGAYLNDGEDGQFAAA